MKYKMIPNGLWENSEEEVNKNELKEFDRIFKEEVNKQLSELEQLEYLDRLSEQTI